MRTVRTHDIISGAVAFLAVTASLAQAETVRDLATSADAIVVGTATSFLETPTNISFDISVERILKGVLPLQTIHVSHEWVRSGGIFDNHAQQINRRVRGIWGLRSTASSDWEILPVAGGPRSFIAGLYRPVADTLAPEYRYPPGTSLLDTLIFEVAAGAEAGGGRPDELVGVTGSTNTPALQSVFAHLLNSQKPSVQAIGLAGMLSGSQPRSIAELGRLWPSLAGDPNRHQVLFALRNSFRDPTPGAVQELAQLAGATTTSTELRKAAVWALASIHTKESLPLLASLLLSSDPDEQARGVVGLSSFANGCPSQTPDNVKSMEYLQFKNPSPYRNTDTMANFAIGGINIPPGDTHLAQLVSFWSTWWKQHPELH
jgi:hypothetical protein